MNWLQSVPPCHSRRFQLGDNIHDQGELLDKLVPSLLVEGLYHPDGQILDEVYVWGSFTQSKMYQHDVRCNDCHDPHTTKPVLEDNNLCLQCHRSETYDNKQHHFHKRTHEGKPVKGYLCVKCHMPGQYYMGIDYRPDHSIRIPRPDLTKSLNTPNSCSAKECHAEKDIDWVIENTTTWYGKKSKPHYGTVLAAGRLRQPEAQSDLINIAEDSLLPTIVRATALSLLQFYSGTDVEATFKRSLEEEDALLRYTAANNLTHFSQETILRLIPPKLYDPVRAVRLEAASLLANVPIDKLRSDDREQFKTAIEEYKRAMEYNGDLAAQRFNLGNLASSFGNVDEALDHYKKSISIDDQFYPAKVNLAMQFNGQGDNDKAVLLLQDVVDDYPRLYEPMYSLGLLLAEMQRFEESAHYLGKAADGMPHYTRVRYNEALALFKINKWEEGIEALQKAIDIEPANQEYFVTLARLYLQSKQINKALELANTVLEIVPEHQAAKELINSVLARKNAPQPK